MNCPWFVSSGHFTQDNSVMSLATVRTRIWGTSERGEALNSLAAGGEVVRW
jgi:hypothetical protein